MAEFNEYGEIIRKPRNILDLGELKKKIELYLEVTDYEEATQEKQNLINEMQQEYIEFLQREIGIRNEDIFEYSRENFIYISNAIQGILDKRTKLHIDTKTEAIENEYNQNQEEPDMVNKNAISAETQIEETETQIDYEDNIKQIIMEEISDTMGRIKRILYNLGIDDKKVEEIEDKLYEQRNQMVKYSSRFTEILEDLDKKITKFAIEINEEYLASITNQKADEKNFRESIVVPNEENQIEQKAKQNIVSKFKDEKEHLQENAQEEVKSKFDRLRDDDIF